MTRPRPPRTRIEALAADQARHLRRKLAREIERARVDIGLSQRQLARAAGLSATTIRDIEQSDSEPTITVLARAAAALGMSLGVNLFPGTGPLIRDHVQAAMISALLDILDERWRPRPEVAVSRPVRGVIDLVLEDDHDGSAVACEAQSELRRVEQQLRWSAAKADALQTQRAAASSGAPATRVGRLLLLRSTVRTRAIVAQFAALIEAALPAPTRPLYEAVTGAGPWPGDGLLWCRVEGGTAEVMDRPPRGIQVGR